MTNVLLFTVKTVRIKKGEDQLRQTTRGLRTREPKYIVV